MQKVWNKYKD